MLFKSILFSLFLSWSSMALAADLVEIKVEGLTSEGSEVLLRQNLEALPEAEMAEVDATTNRAFISVKEGTVLPDSVIADAVEKAGFAVITITRSGVPGVVNDGIQP